MNPRKYSLRNDSWDLGPPEAKFPVWLQYAKWAPTADKLVHQLFQSKTSLLPLTKSLIAPLPALKVFVYENDVYFKNGPDSSDLTVRVTDTGSTDENPVVVYNGIPDWLYEGKSDFFI